MTPEKKEQSHIDLPFVEPIKYKELKKLPKSKNLLSAIEFEGVTVTVYIPRGREIEIMTQDNLNVAENFPELTKGFQEIGKKQSLILDGRILYYPGKQADIVEQRLENARDSAAVAWLAPCSFSAYDIAYESNLYLAAFEERQNRLDQLLTENFQRRFSISPNYFQQNHSATLIAARQLGYNRIIFKGKSDKRPANGSTWSVLSLN